MKKTLLSILDQDYKNIEVWVISNGRNEENRLVVTSLQDQRLRYLELEKNTGGPSGPRNFGIEHAKGVYVAFCDDDDLWTADKLSKQVKALEENPQYGLCYAKMLRFDDKHEWSVPHEEGPATLASLLYENTVPISAVIVRKHLLEKIGHFSESKLIGSSEDYEFLLRHAAYTDFYFIDEYLIKYWSGNDRMTPKLQNVKGLMTYLLQVLASYRSLWKTKKIRWIKLVRPTLFHLKYFVKNIIYLPFSV